MTRSLPDPNRVRRVGVRGHARTVWPVVKDRVWPLHVHGAEPWSTELTDPHVGRVRLSGVLRDVDESDAVVVLVHGLGGRPDSVYMRHAARALQRAGIATLALALRGADRRGEDFYNIALTADLHATLRSEGLARYTHIFVLGFSMGGHVALHLAHAPQDPRVRAVAALSTPLDLHDAQRHIDGPRARTYCKWVLGGLKAIYTAVAARRPVPSPVEEVQAVTTIYDWDRLTIAPRYGFDSPEHYYRELSAARIVDDLQVPALLVLGGKDPMVPYATVAPALPSPRGRLDVRFVRGAGHIAFPRGTRLGYDAPPGVLPQVLAWFRDQLD